MAKLPIRQAFWLRAKRSTAKGARAPASSPERGAGMLKITTAHDDGIERVLKLESKLLAAWVGELQEACRLARAEGCHVRLDLSGLSFVDVLGTIALRELVRQGVHITTASPFVGELLKET
jgi:hypothetical protein